MKNVLRPSGTKGISTRLFAYTIGLNRADALYEIKESGDQISPELAQRISDRFPQYSPEWIMCLPAVLPSSAYQHTEIDLTVVPPGTRNCASQHTELDLTVFQVVGMSEITTKHK